MLKAVFKEIVLADVVKLYEQGIKSENILVHYVLDDKFYTVPVFKMINRVEFYAQRNIFILYRLAYEIKDDNRDEVDFQDELDTIDKERGIKQ